MYFKESTLEETQKQEKKKFLVRLCYQNQKVMLQDHQEITIEVVTIVVETIETVITEEMIENLEKTEKTLNSIIRII